MNSEKYSGPLVVFVSLAAYQTSFFVELARQVKARGGDAEIISCHERSVATVVQAGFKGYNVYGMLRNSAPLNPQEEVELLQRSGCGSILPRLLSHERETFLINDLWSLKSVCLRKMAVFDGILRDIKERAKDRDVFVLQELGGFGSNIASFYAARMHALDNVFLEPSFFRGRVSATVNTFASPDIDADPDQEILPCVSNYIRESISLKSLVIPRKDAKHYRGPFSKLADLHNMKRLVEKLTDKLFNSYQEEFAHEWVHVKKHAKMAANAVALRPWFKKLGKTGKLAYYPLHVPWDVALTIRSPECLDQLALIDYIARSLPHDCYLAIKEHPALVGAMAAGEMKNLLRRNPNVQLIDPKTNNYDVMRAADCVVTVNSKSGAEACCLGKPVIVIGDAFYRNAPFVHRVNSLVDLATILGRVLGSAYSAPIGADEVARFFSSVWESTLPCEINDSSADNCSSFAESLLKWRSLQVQSQTKIH